jgi:radical SAM/Cys-rich protein
MAKEVMEMCLISLQKSDIQIVDLTGGAPEMNPNFRWFVTKLSEMGKKVMVRCNLTIIESNKKYHDLPLFFKEHGIEVVSSLPYFTAIRTDAQRGAGVFEDSIAALKKLNAVGYGIDPNLKLNLVYNPTGAFLPGDQAGLQQEFKTKLFEKYQIQFHQLYAITNLPVSRFLEHLMRNNQYQSYMQQLVEAFNPMAVQDLMCKTMVSVSWDGYLYDCDFNQMLDLKIEKNSHIRDFDTQLHIGRKIRIKKHCFGCTAGAGSSCGGVIA